MSQLTPSHQEYIQSKVNPTLEALVTQVLIERPENPVPFMIKWLSEQTQAPTTVSEVGEAEALRKEIASLKAEVKALEEKVKQAGASASQSSKHKSPAHASKHRDDISIGSESEENDDDLDELPPEPYARKGPRASVSAEAYGDFNRKEAFTPKIYDKTPEQTLRCTELLKKSILFKFLEPANLKVIVGAVQFKEVPAKSRIINEGEDGDVMYIIETGAFDCIKHISGEEKVVKKCGPGDVFGELTLLYNAPRAASVMATEASTVWQLDRGTFNHLVRDASIKRRERYDNFLKSVKILESLGVYERTQLADALEQETIAAGKAVVTQGEVGGKFYIVEDGELVVRKRADDGKESEVMRYTAGDYFGELSLLKSDNTARAASVITVTEARLLSIDRKTFQAFLGCLEDIMKSRAQEVYSK